MEADHGFARNLGAKLGLRSYTETSPDGNSRTQGSFAIGLPLGDSGLRWFEPVTAAVTLLRKNATHLLDFELSALESDGQSKILSNPCIMTADMVKATI